MKKLFQILFCGLLLLGLTCGSALASQKTVGNSIILEETDNSVVLAPSPDLKDKSKYDPDEDYKLYKKMKGISSVKPHNASVTAVIHDLYDATSKDVTPPGRPTDSIINSFNTECDEGYLEAVMNGSSFSEWVGSGNCDCISQTDKFQVNGLNVSASPAGGSYTVSGNSLTWSKEYDNGNYWSINHYYDDLTFTYLSPSSCEQWTTSTFTWGNDSYTIQSHDKAFM